MYRTHNEGVNLEFVNGTHFQGYIQANYADLIKLFGKPSDNYDDYKSDAEWIIQFQDGTVATIYNYKNGKNYLGDEGTPTEQIKTWNVGGHSDKAYSAVRCELFKKGCLIEKQPF